MDYSFPVRRQGRRRKAELVSPHRGVSWVRDTQLGATVGTRAMSASPAKSSRVAQAPPLTVILTANIGSPDSVRPAKCSQKRISGLYEYRERTSKQVRIGVYP
jgi:hypothetical protein